MLYTDISHFFGLIVNYRYTVDSASNFLSCRISAVCNFLLHCVIRVYVWAHVCVNTMRTVKQPACSTPPLPAGSLARGLRLQDPCAMGAIYVFVTVQSVKESHGNVEGYACPSITWHTRWEKYLTGWSNQKVRDMFDSVIISSGQFVLFERRIINKRILSRATNFPISSTTALSIG